MTESKNHPQSFWDKRAATFPTYTGQADSYEVRMLNMAKKEGVVFNDKLVLDVGCGSGLYSIGLALEARRLTALDISPKMLFALKTQAVGWGLTNIDYVQSDWLDFESDETYDLIFCSMNPVFRGLLGREKLLRFAPVKVVYIGWAAPMRSDVTSGLYKKYGLDPEGVIDTPEMKGWLKGMSLNFSSSVVSGSWRVPFSLPDLRYNCLNTLNNYGIRADPGWLNGYLAQFRGDHGTYIESTSYTVEMLVFQIPPGQKKHHLKNE